MQFKRLVVGATLLVTGSMMLSASASAAPLGDRNVYVEATGADAVVLRVTLETATSPDDIDVTFVMKDAKTGEDLIVIPHGAIHVSVEGERVYYRAIVSAKRLAKLTSSSSGQWSTRVDARFAQSATRIVHFGMRSPRGARWQKVSSSDIHGDVRWVRAASVDTLVRRTAQR